MLMKGCLDDLTLNYDQLRTQVHYFAKAIVGIINFQCGRYAFPDRGKKSALIRFPLRALFDTLVLESGH